VPALAWTSTGGEILYVEATKMPGKKQLTLTGQLGDVMKESVRAALSYLNSRGGEIGIPQEEFDKHDFHVHVPAGATPKDGPSAGITMCTALASVLIGKPATPCLAMTGEITLRGDVLPIGGLKQKSLAAYRAGIKKVLIPKNNESDLEDVPPEIKSKVKFVLVDTVSDVLKHALGINIKSRKPARSRVVKRKTVKKKTAKKKTKKRR
jgi:ATP-dependent Lon protease